MYISKDKVKFLHNKKTLKYILDYNRKPINLDEHPYVATRYITHTWDINDDVILNFYVTDWWQSDKINEKKDIEFDVYITINKSVKTYKVKIGENSINIGTLPMGEYVYLLQAKDMQGRYSHELYNEFRVIDERQRELDINSNTHIVTDEDLTRFNITKNGNIEDLEVAHNTKMGLQEMFNHFGILGIRKLVLPTTTYIIDVEGRWANGVGVQYIHNVLSIPKNFILDLNGSTIKQTISTPDQKVGCMITINNGYDSHIQNGTFIGDYDLREFIPKEGYDYIPGEQGACCMISGSSKYCSFNNLIIKNFCGYTFTVGIEQAGILPTYDYVKQDNLYQSINFEQGFVNSKGELEYSDTRKTTQYLDLEHHLEYGYFRTGQYLMFLYEPHGDSVVVKYHFYDKDKNYLTTKIGHGYRDVFIPKDALFVRATYIFDEFNNAGNMCKYIMHTPRNCDISNIHFENTRTCALAPYQGNNLLIDGCTFARCATNITPVAIDFEDGWHNMQDYCLQNCEILEPVGTADIVIVGGLDMIFRNNKNWRIYSRNGFTRGQVYQNNELVHGNIGLTTHRMSAFSIVENNMMHGVFENGLGSVVDIQLVLEGNQYYKVAYSPKEKTIVRNCVFNWDNHTLQFRSPIIGGTFYKCTFNNYVWSMGHINNFKAYDCKINNMDLEALQGNFVLDNCVVNKCSFGNYNIDINIDIKNTTMNDFNFKRIGFVNCNISYNANNSVFNNLNSEKNIINDSFQHHGNQKLFKVKTSNVEYLNNTVIANDIVLNNPNLDFSELN